jgi:hypothetical protein
MGNLNKLYLIESMIANMEREYSTEVHSGYLPNAKRIRGKLIRLYQGKRILNDRVERDQLVKRVFKTGGA